MTDHAFPAVFFDRDGVLSAPVRTASGSERPAWSVEELRLLPGATAAVALVRTAGFVPVVVTNQPDVARGDLPRSVADQITAALQRLLPEIAEVYVCPHDGSDHCPCRKPKAGMLLAAADELGIDLASSWLVGDRWVDIAAAQAAGCRSVLIRNAQSWLPTSAGAPPAGLTPTLESDDVLDAVRKVVASV